MLRNKSFVKSFKISSLFAHQQSNIALDIGSSAIKLLELEIGGKERMLKQFSCLTLSPGADLPVILKTFVESQKISGRPVNTSLSGQSVIMRYITLPRMNLHELKGTMQFEAGQYIPLPRDEVILDCAIVKEKAEDNKMLVVLAAVKKTVIYERISLLEKAGLTAKVIDIDCFCLSNAFNHSYQWASDATIAKTEVIGLLNIGANFTNMAILEGGILRFSRDIAFGGRELSLNNLAGEISSSIDYFENQSGKRLEKVYLAGGAAEASNVLDFLNHHLGVQAALYDFFTGIKFGQDMNTQELKAKGNLFVVALGLVLR
ncbi:MAG: hypothetical protein A3D27_00440 [Omnitrophica WOR_2 bacterium RIFCSPHIGHO2_02_FULL_46_37]|nr:MAG: hypothetical protein A3D27_00440 [Omnitrophica WOR_2 bacterium RIFCSPHIGHO2_02_FULL_46_37]OGX43706.1 MAG: hypothetical protein A3H41_03185 [Omnitrophica WOR_2 bacterium RIFCSPLOWO2_02_FULL_45_28]